MVSAECGLHKLHKKAMTAAWGGQGKMWGLNIAEIVLMPQRFPKPFIDKSVFGDSRQVVISCRKQTALSATASGFYGSE